MLQFQTSAAVMLSAFVADSDAALSSALNYFCNFILGQ